MRYNDSRSDHLGTWEMENEDSKNSVSENPALPTYRGASIQGDVAGDTFTGYIAHYFVNSSDESIVASLPMNAPAGSIVTETSCGLFREMRDDADSRLGSEQGSTSGNNITEQNTAQEREDQTDSERNHEPKEASDSEESREIKMYPGEEAIVTINFSYVIPMIESMYRLSFPTIGASHRAEYRVEQDAQDDTSKDTKSYSMSVKLRCQFGESAVQVTSPNISLVQSEPSDEGYVNITAEDNSFNGDECTFEWRPASSDVFLIENKDNKVYCKIKHSVQIDCNAAVKILVDASGSMGKKQASAARNIVRAITNEFEQYDQSTLSYFSNGLYMSHTKPALGNSARRKYEMRGCEGGTLMSDALSKLSESYYCYKNGEYSPFIPTTDESHGQTPVAGTTKRIISKHPHFEDILLVSDGCPQRINAMLKGSISWNEHRCNIIGLGGPSHDLFQQLAKATGGDFFNMQPEIATDNNFSELADRVLRKLKTAVPRKIEVSLPKNTECKREVSYDPHEDSIEIDLILDELPAVIEVIYSVRGKRMADVIDTSNSLTSLGISSVVSAIIANAQNAAARAKKRKAKEKRSGGKQKEIRQAIADVINQQSLCLPKEIDRKNDPGILEQLNSNEQSLMKVASELIELSGRMKLKADPHYYNEFVQMFNSGIFITYFVNQIRVIKKKIAKKAARKCAKKPSYIQLQENIRKEAKKELVSYIASIERILGNIGDDDNQLNTLRAYRAEINLSPRELLKSLLDKLHTITDVNASSILEQYRLFVTAYRQLLYKEYVIKNESKSSDQIDEFRYSSNNEYPPYCVHYPGYRCFPLISTSDDLARHLGNGKQIRKDFKSVIKSLNLVECVCHDDIVLLAYKLDIAAPISLFDGSI